MTCGSENPKKSGVESQTAANVGASAPEPEEVVGAGDRGMPEPSARASSAAKRQGSVEYRPGFFLTRRFKTKNPAVIAARDEAIRRARIAVRRLRSV